MRRARGKNVLSIVIATTAQGIAVNLLTGKISVPCTPMNLVAQSKPVVSGIGAEKIVK